ADVAPAVAAMTTLNAGAARAMLGVGVHAATDVTGFGLLGHLRTLLEASGAAAEVRAAAVPLLPGARAAAERGAVPGGTERNAASVADAVSFAAGVDRTARLLLADAQTSGGLLIAVAAERADALVAALRREATPAADVIGRVVTGEPGTIAVVLCNREEHDPRVPESHARRARCARGGGAGAAAGGLATPRDGVCGRRRAAEYADARRGAGGEAADDG